MADENTDLEAFFASKHEENTPSSEASISIEEEISDVNLEDEFAKLLENFISGDSKASEDNTLDSFITPTEPPQSKATKSTSMPSLDSFVTESSIDDAELDEIFKDNTPQEKQEENIFSDIKSLETQTFTDEQIKLKPEELELSTSFFNFREGILALANKKNLKTPKLDYKDEQLYPNYKPSIGKKIAQYLLSGWDILNRVDPENMKKLDPKATDEEYLIFAEQLIDTDINHNNQCTDNGVPERSTKP